MSSLTGITELEDLTLFVQERVQEFDSTIDTSTGSSFYNNVISPLITRLGPDPYDTPIRDFIIGRLSVEFPDLVLQDGEPLDDYAIKIMQILLEAYRRQIQQVSNNQSLEDPSILNEREADALGANFFVRRRQGGISVGVARLYYSAPQGAIVTPNNAVFDGSGRRFFPVENQAISADNMLFNVENNLFFFDIIVRAEEEGTDFNIEPNTLVGIEEASSVVKVSNKASFEEGADKETTADFIERVENSLTEKSLVTLRGITARMLDVFESIRLIQVIGHGDPEMNRDILRGSSETPSPYAFFLGSTGDFPLSGETDAGETTIGTDDFDDSSINFLADGVTTSMILRILEGADAGDYAIATVLNGHLDITGTFSATATGLSYQIIDPTSQGPQIDLATPTAAIMTPEGLIKDSFLEVGVRTGDKLTYADVANGTVTQHEVTDVSSTAIQVDPEIDGDIVSKTFLLSNPVTAITISDIPGGILQPTTDAGTIEINSDEVHLGGAVDVFVRAGTPIERDTVLEGVLDGQPLHFGVDLESFGEVEDTFVHLTEEITFAGVRPSSDRFGDPVTDHILILQEASDILPNSSSANDGVTVTGTGTFTDADGTFQTDGVVPGMLLVIALGPDLGIYEILEVVSETEITVAATFTGDTGVFYAVGTQNRTVWHPTEEDVGRYIQVLGGGPQGLLEIVEVIGDEYFGSATLGLAQHFTRIKVSLTNQEDPATPYVLGADDSSIDLEMRMVEKVSMKDKVRDRDGSRVLYGNIDTGIDLRSKGAVVGDSVVIETGDDAGIYSVRRVLDWLNTGDTLVLDRDLTKTHTPTGTGDGSGLRYRIADELNVDLVTPQVVKIPLGAVFAGDDLSTVAGIATVTVGSSTNFLLAGVEEGDTLEILEGDDAGTFSVVSVTGTSAVLDAAPSNTANALTFTVYRSFSGVERPMVRVKEIELLDSNSQPTGIKVPYGDNIDARALGVFSNRAEGVQQESFTGETQAGTGGFDVRLYDANVDFVAEGVVPGFRLNVFNTTNAGRYTVAKVGAGDGLPTDNYIEVAVPADGGTEFTELVEGVHFSVGLPSSGIARLYFQEPTTVEIQTGLSGGRINEEESGTPKEFHFSEVDGYSVLPAGGESSDRVRDIRVVRNRTTVTPGEYESIVELTDPTGPGVFSLELQVGDLLEVNEQIPFRRTDGTTFKDLGIFGTPAGLQTTAGSSRVTVPSNSLIDFVAMNDVFPLPGQLLFIDEGADEGEYVIEEVVDSKTLRLNAVMTGSTETLVHREISGLRDATLTPGASSTVMEDTTDGPGTQIGNFITIFEATRHDLFGTFEIKSIPGVGQVEIDLDPAEITDVDYVGGDTIPFGTGLFSWINTASDENVFHSFRIYKTVPTQAEITEVATQRGDIDLEGIGETTSSTVLENLSANFLGSGVKPGDRLEILTGQCVGVYPIASVGVTTVTIVANAQNLFPTTTTDNPYRIWAGLHGSRTMLTVGKFESDDGLLEPGDRTPFRIIRPGVFRVSSTEMEDNFDGSFYYVDVNVESLGSGDEFNLDRLDRMVVQSGVRADGYTYTVENNNLTFSPFEQVSLDFDRRFLPVGNSDSPENLTEVSGRNLKVVYSTSTTAKLVHDLMRSDQERPINASPLGRHFLPSFVYVQLLYRGGPSADTVGPIIEDYINSLGAEEELEVSDLEAFIARRDANSIEHPITIAVITHDIDRNLVVNRTENRLGGLLEVPYNGTGRISAFFAILGEGLTVEKLT